MRRISCLKIGILIIMAVSLFAFTNCSFTELTYKQGPAYSKKTKPGPPPWAPAHGRRAKHRYRYYRSDGIYYDSGRSIYFFYRDGRWRISVSLPTGVIINVNDYITLEMDDDKPYKYHSEVKKKYPPGQKKKKYKKKKKKD